VNRSIALTALVEGSVFRATTPNGASYICLVNSTSDNKIRATRITTQEKLVFDRSTGTAEISADEVVCTIDSIAPLPTEVYDILLRLDRRYGHGDDPALSQKEKDALLFVSRFYSFHPL
jgi:hypothetical protein